MAAGKLDRPIVIQQAGITRAPSGQEIETWTTVASVWAELLQEAGGETFADGAQRIAARTVMFKIRYRAGITPKMRVTWDGQVYGILDVSEHDRRRWLHLRCEVIEARSGA